MILALQTYTIRSDARNDLPKALQRLRTMGMTRLEWARLPMTQESARLIREQGMTIVAVQATRRVLERRFSQIVGFCRETGCPLVVVSVLSLEAILRGERQLRRFALRLNQLAARYKEVGIRLAFHHHAFEFRTILGETKLDCLVRWTDPDVSFVLDTYWIRRSGEDPLGRIGRLGDRVVGLHLRDCLPAIGRQKPGDCPVGQGIIDFEGLLHSLPSSVRYGVIEQNSRNPWSDLSISMNHLNSLPIETKEPIGGTSWKTEK